MKPLVTIITPTYNIIQNGRKESLIDTIKSVEEQTYPNIEHLIIDGCSEDETLEFLMEYTEKLIVFSEKDKGLYDAMNKGVAHAKGEYILILNSDDKFISSFAVEHSVNAIIENKADFSFAKARCVDSYGKETPMPNCYNPDISHIFTEMTISHQTVLCKKSCFKDNFFSLDLEIGSDYEWLLKLCMKGAVPTYLDEYIVEYHRGGKSDRIKNYHLYIEERIQTFYNVFSEYDNEITMYMCKMVFFEQFVGDRIWKCIQEHVRFDVKRGYDDKIECSEQMLENIWYVAAKNALLLRLFHSYTQQLAMGESLADKLLKRGYCNCAIYGYGNIGQCVYIDLLEHHFPIEYVVDKTARQIIGEDSLKCAIYTLEDELPDVDVMIVTPVFYFDEIRAIVSKKCKCTILPLDDFVQP